MGRPFVELLPTGDRSVAYDLRTRDGIVQKQLAGLYVVSRLRSVVLRGGVEVAQPPLQR
jgi:hypothetical protein